ncbi:MAG: hypothetical protein R3B54_03390 [Bdellovibrionota bacterium]
MFGSTIAREWEPQNYEKEFRGEVTLRSAAEVDERSDGASRSNGGYPTHRRDDEARGIESDIPKVPSISLEVPK